MNTKNLVIRIFTFTILSFLLFIPCYGYIYGNGAGSGYNSCTNGGGLGICSQNDEIEYYIILGGGYYLDANRHIQGLLRVVEWQDIKTANLNELKYLVENALMQMKNAGYMYEVLINTAESTPYNETVLTLLKDFEYDTFMKENDLNPMVFDHVRSHLQPGDITGVFRESQSYFKKIIAGLEVVRTEVYSNKIPGIALLWQINNTLSTSSMFGNYVAMVFKSIQ